MYKLLFCLLWASVCSAGDWSSLYQKSDLVAQKPRLEKAIRFLIEKEIQPFIPKQEATAFGLTDIDLPLTGFRSDPLDYYSQQTHIVLPVNTLLFVEDLSRTYAWMWANRLSTKTVDEYLAMLRYRNAADFPGARYPAPRDALHIPADALSNPKVVEAAVRLRRTACAFMLLHQFAHLQAHDQPSNSRAYSEAQEEAADHYALDVLKENSVTPTGVFLIFQSMVYFESNQQDQIHTITAHRLSAMAHLLDLRINDFLRGRSDKTQQMDAIHSMAVLMVQDAEWLSVRDRQAELQQFALRTSPETLQPRPLPKATK